MITKQQNTIKQRTYRVTGNILCDNDMYFSGDEITFGPHVKDSTIEQLKQDGNLEGPRAKEIERKRIMSQMDSGIEGMEPEELEKLWHQFLTETQEQRLAKEKAEARIKEDVTGAMKANKEVATMSPEAGG